MRNIQIILILLSISFSIFSQENSYRLEKNIPYYPKSGESYQNERCVLDIYYPSDQKDFATLVWFHGGGLTGGEKHIPELLKEKGIAVISVNYRLYPKVKAPVYIEDAAAAVAWTFKNIEKYGGNPDQVFLSGHSAGGYLVSMVGLDKSYLEAHSINANRIAALIPLSGHTITHFTVRKERGIEGTQPVIDNLAPLFHIRDDAPPLLLITGDRELELLGRYEENAYMMRMMKVVGHQNTRIFELDGYGHNIVLPSCPLILNEIEKFNKQIKSNE